MMSASNDPARLHERLEPELACGTFRDILPPGQDKLALDIGNGSGRNAAWLRQLGYDTVAIEAPPRAWKAGDARHPDAGIRWLRDRLPELRAVHRLGLAFDVIWLGDTLAQVQPNERRRAFRKVVALLKPSGLLLLSAGVGSGGEIETLARTYGLVIISQDRSDGSSAANVLRLPDDGSGTLPLLRGIILNAEKTATYKLGLLRSIARIADSAPALAIEWADEDIVDLPLGAVALNWVRMYLPLVAQDLPQLPGNEGAAKLGFAKQAFQHLIEERVASQDLRIGSRFGERHGPAVAQALSDASKTITRMPVNFTRYPHSNELIFPAHRGRASRFRGEIILDAATLRRYGTISVPGSIWRTLQRLGAWIEPVLIAEWARLIQGFGERRGRTVVPGEAEAALRWLDPDRDTRLARTEARRVMSEGHALRCVWTGETLRPRSVDIDHCLPWTAWPCGDLWNLLPAQPAVNRRIKRNRLPSTAALEAARDGIQAWWQRAWEHNPALADRFWREAEAALPIGAGRDLDDVFAGLEWRRLRLQQDQQVPEWGGVAAC
jgi:SAM-dependent methyltransferase